MDALFPPVKQPFVPLTEGETVVIKADDPKYDRGLVVKLTGKGGYDMAYWYDSPDKLYPAEIKIDGKSITKDGLVVHIGYHPELAEYTSGMAKNPTDQIVDKDKLIYALGYTGVGALLGRYLFDSSKIGAAAGAIAYYFNHKR